MRGVIEPNEVLTLDLYREVPGVMKSGMRSELIAGTFDKVVRSEPLARAPRCLKLWVFKADEGRE